MKNHAHASSQIHHIDRRIIDILSINLDKEEILKLDAAGLPMLNSITPRMERSICGWWPDIGRRDGRSPMSRGAWLTDLAIALLASLGVLLVGPNAALRTPDDLPRVALVLLTAAPLALRACFGISSGGCGAGQAP